MRDGLLRSSILALMPTGHNNPYPDRDKRLSNWAYRDYLVLAYLHYIYPGARRWDVQRAVRAHRAETAAPTHRAFRRLERAGWIKRMPPQRENNRKENRRVEITSAGIVHLETLETDCGLDARADIRAHVIGLNRSV